MLGEALLFALREVLGVEYPHAWVNVYSRVLRTVIPKAVELELATPTDKVRQSLQYAYFIQMNNGSGSEKIIEPAPHRVSSLPKLDSPSIDTCEI